MQDELRVQTDIRLEGAALEKGMVGIALVNVAEAAQQSVGNQLNIASRRQVEAGDGCSLIEASLNAIGNPRPEQIFIGARDTSIQNDAPLLIVTFRKTQALERNRDQQDITLAGEPALGVPHGVE